MIMKFIRKLIVFIVLVAVLIFCFKHFKPQIASTLMDYGIEVPGITDDSVIFPTSETVVDENGQVNVVVSVPATYTQGLTQDHIDQLVADSEGRIIANLNSDGTATFTVSEEYRDEVLADLSIYYDDTVISNLIVGNVLSITHNADYTVFTATCNPGMSETEILTLAGKLFAVGKLYASFSGNNDARIRVDIVDATNGTVTNSYESDNIGGGLANDAQNWAVDMFDQAVDNVMEHVGEI